jgi:MFS family permease
MSVNKGFMCAFALFINLTGLLLGYAMAYSNQVTDLLNAKLGWFHDDDLATKKQAYIGTSVVLGMTIGAVSGGQLMKIGRRKAVLIACTFGIAGNIITNFLSF